MDIPLTGQLIEKIRSVVNRHSANRSNGMFDLRQNVAVVVAKETGQKHVIPLVNIHISEARQIGLDHELSQFEEQDIG